MKKNICLIILFCLAIIHAYSQKSQKITLGMNYSFGWHYTKSDINNPQAIAGILGYEFLFCEFFGLSTGVSVGSFSQKVGYEIGEIRNAKDLYRANFVTPYLSPKLYLEIGSDDQTDRARSIYLENLHPFSNRR